MTRLIILEVEDTQTQDDIGMAIAMWNNKEELRNGGDGRRIRIVQQLGIIVGES